MDDGMPQRPRATSELHPIRMPTAADYTRPRAETSVAAPRFPEPPNVVHVTLPPLNLAPIKHVSMPTPQEVKVEKPTFSGPLPPKDITFVEPPKPNRPVDVGLVDPAFNPLARTFSSTVVIPESPFQSIKRVFGSLRRGRVVSSTEFDSDGMTAAMRRCQIRVIVDREWHVSGGIVSGWVELENNEVDPPVDSEVKAEEVWLGEIHVALVGCEEVHTKNGKKRRTFLDRRCLLQDRTHPTDAVMRARPPDKDGYWRARRGKSSFPFAIPLYTQELGEDGWPRALELPSSLETSAGRITYTLSGVVQYRDDSHRGTLTHHRNVDVYEFVDPVDAVAMRSRVVTAQARKKPGWLMLEHVGVGPGGVFLSGNGSVRGEDDGDDELEMAAAIERGLVAAGGVIYVRVLVRNDTKRKVVGLRLGLYRRAVKMDPGEATRSETLAYHRSTVADASRTKLVAQRVFRGPDHRFSSGVARECILALPVPPSTDLTAFSTAKGAKLIRIGYIVQVAAVLKFGKDLTLELPVAVMHPTSWIDPPPGFESPLANIVSQGWLIPPKHPLASGSTPAHTPNSVPGATAADAIPTRTIPHRADLVSVSAKEQNAAPMVETKRHLENVLLQDRYVKGFNGSSASPLEWSKPQTGAFHAPSPVISVHSTEPAPMDLSTITGAEEERVPTPVSSIRHLGGLTQLRIVNPDASGMSGTSTMSSNQSLLAIDSVILGALDKPMPASSALSPVVEGDESVRTKPEEEEHHAAIFTNDDKARKFFRVPTGYTEPIRVSDQIPNGESVTDTDAASIASFDTGNIDVTPALPSKTENGKSKATTEASSSSLPPILSDDEEDASGLVEFKYEVHPDAQSTLKPASNEATAPQPSSPSNTFGKRIIRVLGGSKRKKEMKGIEGKKTEDAAKRWPPPGYYADDVAWPE